MFDAAGITAAELRVVHIDENEAVAGTFHGILQNRVDVLLGAEDALSFNLRDVTVGNEAHTAQDLRHNLCHGALAGTAAADKAPAQEALPNVRLPY